MKKFIGPNFLGCLLWPPRYLLPGVLAGVAIDVPAEQSGYFKWLLLGVALIIWLAIWLGWRWLRGVRKADWASRTHSAARFRWLAPGAIGVALAAVIAIQNHPMMPMFRQ